MRRSPMLGRTATPMMTPMMMNPAQTSLLRMASCASFAKYQRTKPHLNVGTIGKCSDLSLAKANAPQFSSNPSTLVKVMSITVRLH